MRILLIHSDYLNYNVKNKTPVAEDIEEAKKEGSFDDSLVVFTAVEKDDENNPEGIVKNLVSEVKKTNDQVKAENIVLYPYAHLSSSLSSPKVAVQILKDAEEALLAEDFNVKRVPFGWYKAFEISCKGHPLSELSRTITADNADEAKVERKPSKWQILEGNKITQIEDFEFNNKAFKQLVDYELGQGASDEGEPPHVKLMREKEICDYEPASDVGNLRWYPKGRLIRDLLADYVYNLTVDNGAMPIETPIFYDLDNEAIYQHAYKFGERQYRTDTKKNLMLRFACCFGAFRTMADSYLTWKNLPAKVYELSTYSFRFEKKGEVVGLKRLRAFTMPDFHSFCADVPASLEEFSNQTDMCMQTGKDLELDFEVIFRATQDFFEENEEWMYEIAEKFGKPILLEVLPERHHYWVCKIDLANIDALGRPIENPTVQIDVESGKRFGISYLGEDGEQHNPTILHCSPTGSIERVLCAMLEKTAIELNEKSPMLPTWLSPIQARILTVGESHKEFAEELYEKIKASNIRVDIDDRDESVGKKIRNASKEWIPYIFVVGDKEVESGKFQVTVRETGEKVDMTVDELIAEVNEKCEGKPFRRLPLPKDISRRINFQ
ncbi:MULTISPECIES: threonine--tRNA ligase [Methanobrevibacter]|uniref:threonine--tRNA ligase n=1 Tax=Methanobrevibacter TaxID=2172 RepID=UPI0015B84521|nr:MULTISPECIES: threonine--tRNA ligase [Methanobrevibacter]MBS7258118.1 threonine--tRNA ligase [Methanobrevibacter sp.]MCI7428814.1 threonine--tRNA ligase [Methanobrevibacter sp.]MDD6776488.1 threonine--tRNA ligase [Methanobacteriaceae archaeon]MDY3096767.1 threonine--tRNA ligase [Methanobrevibacter sp.]